MYPVVKTAKGLPYGLGLPEDRDEMLLESIIPNLSNDCSHGDPQTAECSICANLCEPDPVASFREDCDQGGDRCSVEQSEQASLRTRIRKRRQRRPKCKGVVSKMSLLVRSSFY